MRVLVTGASGFTGRAMITYLATQENTRITCFGRKTPVPCSRTHNVSWIEGDILNPGTMDETIAAVKPEGIIHLAGLNHGSFQELHETNVTGTQNILDAALRINPACRILVVSSAAVYGYAGTTPVDENRMLHPLSEYGVSKAAQDTLCREYHETKGCMVTVARPFNLIGPDQPAAFVCGRILHQVIEIEQGKRTHLDLLEIQSCRDFIDVRDAVRAYGMLLSHTNFREDCAGKAFNIGSGNAYAISNVIDVIEEITGNKYLLHLPATPPPITIPSQMSDNTRIYRLTGWRPQRALKESLADMLDAARTKIP